MIEHTPSRQPPRGRAVAAILAPLLIAGVALLSPSADARQGDTGAEASTPEPRVVADGDVRLELVDQSFDLIPDGNIELSYRITGDIEAVAELVPPTTVPETTIPETTIPETTIPPTTAPPDTAPPESVAPTVAVGPVPTDPATGQELPVIATVVPETTVAPETTTTTTTTTVPPTTTTLEPIPLIPLSLEITNRPPIDDIDLLRDITGPDPRLVGLPVATDGVAIDIRPLITVIEPGVATMTITVPTDSGANSQPDRLRFDREGIHPILVTLRVADQVVARHGTVVERVNDPSRFLPSVDLAIVASIDDPGPSGTLREVADGIAALDADADVARILNSTMTLSIPPSLARLAVESSTVNDLPEAFQDDELVLRPATPFNVSSAVAVDRVDAFIRQLNLGKDELVEALPGTPVRSAMWLIDSPISLDAAQVLRDLFVDYLAIPADLYRTSIDGGEVTTDRFVEIDLPDGGVMPILVIDAVGEQLTTEATDEILDEQNATEWAIETIATMRLEQRLAPRAERQAERSRLIATPDLTAPDPRLLLELERFAEKTEAIRFTPASELAGVTDTFETDAAIVLPEVAGPSLEARLEQINGVQLSLASAASMLPADDERLPAWSRQLDAFVSTAYGDAEVEVAIEDLQAQADRLRNAVVPPEPFTFTLLGNDGQIEIRIGNTIDEPLDVLLRLSSPRLTFPEGDRLITLAPNADTTVTIPVRARSNGTSPVSVSLFTPAEEQLADTVTLTSRVNALTGLGEVLTGGLVLVLLTWWFSHWRSRRRSASDEIVSKS